LFSAFLLSDISGLKWLSIGVYLILVIGYINRRNRRVHIPLMLTAFVVDMAMLLYIEFTRDAIQAAQDRMSTLMFIHVLLSVATLVLYVGQIITGIKKLKGKPSTWHRIGGQSLMLTRLGNLVTSFMVS